MIEILKLLGGYAWIVILLIIFGFVIYRKYMRKNNKKLTVTEVTLGPITAAITDIPVKRIAFLSHPIDVAGRPAALPDIKVRVYDEENHALNGKRVCIELESFSGRDILKGVLEQTSDDTGSVVFSNLKIARSGQYNLVVKSDEAFARSVVFEITPPGLDTEFSSKPFGSPEYIETLSRKLSISKINDIITIDDEEI